jgi:hypothetical protein
MIAGTSRATLVSQRSSRKMLPRSRWFVGSVGLGDPAARDEHQPLPAAAQRFHLAFAQVIRRIEAVERDIGSPALVVANVGRQRVEDGVAKRSRHQVRGHLLLDIAHPEAA